VLDDRSDRCVSGDRTESGDAVIRTLVRLEIVQMLRSRAGISGVLLILAAGVFAIDYGRRVIDRQHGAIAQADALQ
jgi:hypothetical protein